MNRNISFYSLAAIGFMLFALFFGAGNLIFPAHLGQIAGDNIFSAGFGFLVTGVGLPLFGVLAIAYSGSDNLQDLSSRVHPIYGILFTALLYLSIGPFFAAPRTGTVAYEVGIAPFVSEGFMDKGLLIFTFLFFIVVLLFSLFPAKLVQNIGKILAPLLIVLLGILLTVAVLNPMGDIGEPQEGYTETSTAFTNGFLEGYNTMDALASLVFAIIIIHAINSFGVRNPKEVFTSVAKAGLISSVLLAVIYGGIMYLGGMSVTEMEIFDNGGPVLNGVADHYFGTFGAIILAGVIILACLTTAIGLVIANAEYFNVLIPAISYKAFVVIFTTFTFIIANFGLDNIITFSLPVLMFLYPLAIVIILLAFTSKLFNDARIVYVITILFTFCISVFDGLTTLTDSLEIDNFAWMNPVINFYDRILPLYDAGLGWFVPALLVIAIGIIVSFVGKAAKN
ncbi:MAG TPA: branched-chain amino acid transport system II carrier protein [Pseudogracilibacillus sp.]|nr:branched-chain amino acid transport system II carrier protein [Pseudogracilibacillus sp.]